MHPWVHQRLLYGPEKRVIEQTFGIYAICLKPNSSNGKTHAVVYTYDAEYY